MGLCMKSNNKYGKQSNFAANAIMLAIIMIVVTVILGAALWAMTSNLGTSKESYEAYNAASEENLGKQMVPVEPIAIDIISKLNVDYVFIENDLMCFYTLHYDSTYTYDLNQNAKPITIRLPEGSIKELEIKVNDNIIERPVIQGNSIDILLPAGRENSVNLKYLSYGLDEYSHEIPKNKFLETFTMKLEIIGIDFDYQEDLPKKCLTPDMIDTSGEKVTMQWNKPSSVLKKDVYIELPKEVNHFRSYQYFLPILILFFIFFTLFYSEGFLRLKKEFKYEHLGFIMAPIVIMYLILGISFIYLHPIVGVLMALIGFIGLTYVIQKKMLDIKKGFKDFFFFQSFSMIFISSITFFQNSIGIIIGTIFVILTVLIILNFIKKYERPVKTLEKQKDINKVFSDLGILQMEKDQAVIQLDQLVKENERLRSVKDSNNYNKNFCVYCGSDVSDAFDFCPKCGKDIAKITNCTRCKTLVSGNEQFCPNCGVGLDVENTN